MRIWLNHNIFSIVYRNQFKLPSPALRVQRYTMSANSEKVVSPTREDAKKRHASPGSSSSPKRAKIDIEEEKGKNANQELAEADEDFDAEAMIAAAEAAEQASSTTPKAGAATATAKQSESTTLTQENDPLALERKTMDPHWFSLLEPAMKTSTFKSLKSFLASEKSSKATIYPPEHLIHSWSRSCPLDKIKVVIVGQDPYHGPNQAHGMSFSVPKGVPVPASLKNIYKELSTEYPNQFKAPTHGNLEKWANQGVLLLNACLTVRAHQAASHHSKGWEPFTIEILKLIAQRAKNSKHTPASSTGSSSSVAPPAKNATITGMFKKQTQQQNGENPQEESNKKEQGAKPQQQQESASSSSSSSHEGGGIVFLSWGLPASKTLAAAGITSTTSPNILILQSAHPSPLSAHRGFLGNGHFKKANDWLETSGGWGPNGGIDWSKL
ncbi:unnamed protein product [Sympodiomycopsis kandeliae]